MSSTARGGKRSPADFYSTPPFAIHRLLERLPLPGGTWLESSAGTGSIIRVVNAIRKDVRWEAFELREECKAALLSIKKVETNIVDFLTMPAPRKYTHDVCLNNVPFSLAQEFIEHTLSFAPWVIHLLRLNYLGTATRNKFFQENCPDVFVIPDRVSFTSDGKSDSIEYCWMVFGPERGRRSGKIEVLNTTPVGERR